MSLKLDVRRTKVNALATCLAFSLRCCCEKAYYLVNVVLLTNNAQPRKSQTVANITLTAYMQ